MIWLFWIFVAFISLLGILIVIGGVQELLEERKSPFLFEVGEKAIRIPAFDFQAHLIAMTNDYWRYTITERKRNWLGQKVYKTWHPNVSHPVVFREDRLMKNFKPGNRAAEQ